MSRRFLLCVFVGLLAISGCAKGGAREVTGTVTFDDKPIQEGYILFVPDDKALGPDGGEIKDGKYKVPAKPVPCHVKITASHETAEKDPMGVAKREEYIPPKYNEKTELTADVGSKEQFNFDLKSK